MKVATSIAELEVLRADCRAAPTPPIVAFVPTMGALHDGHLSLVRLARGVADVVIMSIFVNPLQFGPTEDYAKYPRTLQCDLVKAEEVGVDVVFAPSVAEIYPSGRQVSVSAGPIGSVLEGAARPGHFDGVLTVVLKLLNIVDPDIAVFGRKDAQQLACIRRMVLDFNLDTDIVGAPIVREPDGLAMSSRNRYLSPSERTSALALHAAMQAAEPEQTPAEALAAAERMLAESVATGEIELDYVAVVDAATMAAVPDDYRGPALAVVAARVGTTRLIDNTELTFPEPAAPEPAAPEPAAPEPAAPEPAAPEPAFAEAGSGRQSDGD